MPRQQTHGYSHAIHTAWLDNMRGGSAIKSMVQIHNTTVTTVAEAVSEGVLQLEPVLLSRFRPFCKWPVAVIFTWRLDPPTLHWKRKCLFQNHEYTEGEINMAIQFFNLILYTLIGTSVLGRAFSSLSKDLYGPLLLLVSGCAGHILSLFKPIYSGVLYILLVRVQDAPQSPCQWLSKVSLHVRSVQRHLLTFQLQHFLVYKTDL